MSDVSGPEGPEWDNVDGLLGVVGDGIEIVAQAGDVALVVIETGVARIVLDRRSRRVTSYPLDDNVRGIHDRQSRAWTGGDTPAIVGEDWTWTEVTETRSDDPWGDRVRHPIGKVVEVRGIDL